ncbi:hypothetical protein [Actinokineospora inagensis]|uniref:hypothetical protein n=1 Tax=Actinokineospora inagensis TaxID=103730 RepID=UPI0003F9AE58|nr:hypothetical protein [Actinokineospora inagensis]
MRAQPLTKARSALLRHLLDHTTNPELTNLARKLATGHLTPATAQTDPTYRELLTHGSTQLRTQFAQPPEQPPTPTEDFSERTTWLTGPNPRHPR